MHLYNSWLPLPVAEDARREAESFARVVHSAKDTYRTDDPESVYDTLKWISVIDLFIKARSEVSLDDVNELAHLGLEIFRTSEHKIYVQVRWGNILIRLLNKYGKELSLEVPWRPLYETLIHTHFTRNTGPEGWRLKQQHFETTTSLIRACRRFFPQGSAHEIWSEFRPLLENPCHNSSFEGSGFVSLFLPTNTENQGFYTENWVRNCLDVWGSVQNCRFWDGQWIAVLARIIKHYTLINWEVSLPMLFNRFLNMFEVPVANGGGSYPYAIDVPRSTRFLFSGKGISPEKSIANSIVHLLKPGGAAQDHFEKLVNLLEQYYHPSNGGRWTYSLERFLHYLVTAFQKRLQREQQNLDENKQQHDMYLGKTERVLFVKVILKIIDRGQYSKNERLSETVAAATSILSYVEPSVVLPFLASRFRMALETTTAIHQLKTAMTSVAFACRSILLSSLSTASVEQEESDNVTQETALTELIGASLANALLGMDANDPPKTLATMQLIGSIFSSVAVLDDNMDESSFIPMIRFSEWLDEFLCRLFSLLLHLEPSSMMNEGLQSSATSGTFLINGPYYFCMVQVLFGRLSGSLYKQALKKVSKFVRTNILPGAVSEVGILCCACVLSNPEEAVVQLVQPILLSVISSLQGTPGTGYGGRGIPDTSVSAKDKGQLSPALERAIDYQLKILSVAAGYAGPSILCCKDQLKEVLHLAFDSSSWKVNGAGDHLLRSLFGSMILYYPIDQYRCLMRHAAAVALESWTSTKDCSNNGSALHPAWHIPCNEEVQFADELLGLHLQSALDDLLKICKTKLHSDAGNEKTHLKVTLLRIHSSLQGVLSCLPDFKPSSRNDMGKADCNIPFFIAGASGTHVGCTELRERATEILHVACKYLLEEKSDDSILLILMVRIMDALGSYGSLEYDEWLNHRQAWKLDSPAIVEPPINFIVGSHAKGRKRPRWALIDKAYMHNTWRSSQSSFHLFRTSGSFSPSEHMILLTEDMLKLSLHSYETVRTLASRSLMRMLKRWPSLLSKCVLSVTENLQNSSAPEHAVLGSCSILSSRKVLKHVTMDPQSFSSFLFGVLSSSHHESLKAQKAISELFVKYNIHFSGLSRSILKSLENQASESDLSDVVSHICTMSFESDSSHWRYNLMANRVLLLIAMACSSYRKTSSKILMDTAGHFLKNLRSHLPQTRILAISALNTLLKESPYKISATDQSTSGESVEDLKSSLEGALSETFQEEGFFNETLNSLSHVHIISDGEGSSHREYHGISSIQSSADKSITRFYFEFSSSWPRTPSWISLIGRDTFYSSFARIFKRLTQECGIAVLMALKNPLEEFSNAKERSKQCVAAEAFAGALHSDVNGLQGEWDRWMMVQLQNIILSQSVESLPEWAACIRYAVTGKGKSGTRAPVLRQQILECLAKPLPSTVSTSVVAKRYAFLSAALIELAPQKMPLLEAELQRALLDELLNTMCHSSAQVREAVGVTLSVLCSNIRLRKSCAQECLNREGKSDINHVSEGNWVKLLTEKASEVVRNIQKASLFETSESPMDTNGENGHEVASSEEDVKWLETLFYFVISSLKSGRASSLYDVVVGLLYPIIALQDSSNKELSTLAKAACYLVKWRVISESHLKQAVSVVLSSAEDSNWRIRSATLTYLRSFMYRHTYLLSREEKQKIWKAVENLLVDSQVEVREHAAAVLAGLMKGGEEDFVADFRNRAYEVASNIQKRRKRRNTSAGQSIPSLHGAVLALAATVLSTPYDIPSWMPDYVTLLARFGGEPTPIKSTVTKAVAEFRRTHADTWNIQKDLFTEEQLEVLADTSSSSSYFA